MDGIGNLTQHDIITIRNSIENLLKTYIDKYHSKIVLNEISSKLDFLLNEIHHLDIHLLIGFNRERNTVIIDGVTTKDMLAFAYLSQ